MKKIIILLILFLLSGCTKEVSKEQALYNTWVMDTKESVITQEELPFGVEANVEDLSSSEWMYHIIIDAPTKEVTNIQALVVTNPETKDVFPSIGIFDDAVSLIPGEVNEDNHIVKGIALVGYIPKEYQVITLKVKISYEVEETTKISYLEYSFDKS